jgi:hypothetical protein
MREIVHEALNEMYRRYDVPDPVGDVCNRVCKIGGALLKVKLNQYATGFAWKPIPWRGSCAKSLNPGTFRFSHFCCQSSADGGGLARKKSREVTYSRRGWC